jgi:hypothetical protein
MMATKLTLKLCRLAFPAIFEAKAVNAGDKPSFSAALLIAPNHPQAAAVKAAIKEAAEAKWGAKSAAHLKALEAANKTALHDGNAKTEYVGFEGNLFISARNSARPTVVGQDKSPLTQQDGKPYAGCYVNAVLEFWAQDNSYGKRVNCTLLGLQFAKDGEAFSGGGVASEDDFDDLSMDAEDDLA